MFYKSELQKMRKVFYKYDIRLKQNLKQKKHAPEDTEYSITILNYKGMIDFKVDNVKFKNIRKIFKNTEKEGILDIKKFKALILEVRLK